MLLLLSSLQMQRMWGMSSRELHWYIYMYMYTVHCTEMHTICFHFVGNTHTGMCMFYPGHPWDSLTLSYLHKN